MNKNFGCRIIINFFLGDMFWTSHTFTLVLGCDRSPYYNIELKEMHVAGKPLTLNPTVFDGKYGTVLDSGTTYAYLPGEAFRAFKDAVSVPLRSSHVHFFFS